MSAKKDYTLNGKVNATTWQEFRAAAKEMGINTGTKKYEVLAEEMEEIIMKKNNEKTVNVVPEVVEVVPVGDLPVTNDVIYVGDNTIIEKKEEIIMTAKKKEMTPAEKTYMLMHLIGDHALDQIKKGYGQTINLDFIKGYIFKVEFGIYNYKAWSAKHKTTQEMKDTANRVFKWLVKEGYLELATFSDGKFNFYTPAYNGELTTKDGKKKNLYDSTKFQFDTNHIVPSSYRVTKKMNNWYK